MSAARRMRAMPNAWAGDGEFSSDVNKSEKNRYALASLDTYVIDRPMNPLRALRRVTLLSLCLPCVFTTGTALAAGCPAADAAAGAALSAQQKVQHDSKFTPVGEEGDTDVPVAVQRSLHSFKQALAEAVDARMACAAQSVDIAALNRDLSASLQVKAVTPTEQTRGPAYGSGLDLNARLTSASSAAPLVLVRAGVSIECGNDNVLLGYRWDGVHWKRVLRWQADDYKSIADAYGDPFGVVPLHDGQVAVVHGTPWCSSRWSRFDLDVIAPGEGASAQRGVFHMEHGYFSDAEISFNPTAEGFEMRAQVASLDGDLMQRLGIFRFRVDGDQVTRVQPAANNGRDFVDEWLTIDEAQARQWSDPATAAQALAERTRFNATAKQAQLGMSYGAVRACSDHAARYQVDVQLNTDTPAKAAPHFALIQQARNGFTLVGFNTAADPQCRGADLMSSKGK